MVRRTASRAVWRHIPRRNLRLAEDSGSAANFLNFLSVTKVGVSSDAEAGTFALVGRQSVDQKFGDDGEGHRRLPPICADTGNVQQVATSSFNEAVHLSRKACFSWKPRGEGAPRRLTQQMHISAKRA